MAVDVTPPLEAGAKFIDSYGPNRFKVTGEVFTGSVIVFPDKVVSWDVKEVSDLAVDSFQAVFDADPAVELLLLGCGAKMTLIPAGLRQALRERGMPPDFMDTGAACRSYNILLGEGRRVAAALIAISAA